MQRKYALRFISDSTTFHSYKMLNDIESIDMVSLLSYSVHAAQGNVCLCLTKFSV